MKTNIILTLLLLGLHFSTLGNSSNVGTIIIKIQNIKNKEGSIHVAVYNSTQEFLGDETFLTGQKKVTGAGEVVITFNNVPFGEYAISVFHDENGNGELDMFMGFIPKEPYGFSNNARGKMGPPGFNDAKFSLSKPEMEMVIAIDK